MYSVNLIYRCEQSGREPLKRYEVVYSHNNQPVPNIPLFCTIEAAWLYIGNCL